VDLEQVRLWPMEAEDGPLLQEFFDDLIDFRIAFGEPGHADAVSTFLGLPEGRDYNSKLLLGIWRNQGLSGALDCITDYPTKSTWTIGLLAVANRHRRTGIATSVLTWLARTAAERGATHLRAVVSQTNKDGLQFAASRAFTLVHPPDAPGFSILTKPITST
jgi:GNAT superfamily N-acetyltransferase